MGGGGGGGGGKERGNEVKGDTENPWRVDEEWHTN